LISHHEDPHAFIILYVGDKCARHGELTSEDAVDLSYKHEPIADDMMRDRSFGLSSLVLHLRRNLLWVWLLRIVVWLLVVLTLWLATILLIRDLLVALIAIIVILLLVVLLIVHL
jgi:hypothetical protein